MAVPEPEISILRIDPAVAHSLLPAQPLVMRTGSPFPQGKSGITPRKNRVFGDRIFLAGVLQTTLRAGVKNENTCREGCCGNSDLLGGDRVGLIPGNCAYFPVEYGPKE